MGVLGFLEHDPHALAVPTLWNKSAINWAGCSAYSWSAAVPAAGLSTKLLPIAVFHTVPSQSQYTDPKEV